MTIATPTETALEFANNRLLIDLCGEYDRNIALIEERLKVRIVRRGNRLSVIGDEEGVKAAMRVLQALYLRVEQGRGIELGDIDRELRMGLPGRGRRRVTRASCSSRATAWN